MDDNCALVLHVWSRRKKTCKLTKHVEIFNELRTRCSLEVNMSLFDLIMAETINSATEEMLLWHILVIAVKGLHKEFHRQIFIPHVKGKETQPLIFLAMLRAQAKYCWFTNEYPKTEGCGQLVNDTCDIISRPKGTHESCGQRMERACRVEKEFLIRLWGNSTSCHNLSRHINS